MKELIFAGGALLIIYCIYSFTKNTEDDVNEVYKERIGLCKKEVMSRYGRKINIEKYEYHKDTVTIFIKNPINDNSVFICKISQSVDLL